MMLLVAWLCNLKVDVIFNQLMYYSPYKMENMNALGRKAYMKHLDKIYKQSDVSWFTPVELFKVILLFFYPSKFHC